MWSWRLRKNVIEKTIKTAVNMPKQGLSTSSYSGAGLNLQSVSTVDAADVDVFSKQMKEWWNVENGPMILLHRMNLLRVPFVRDGLVQCSATQRDLLPLKDKKILDVGCGGGILSEGLARLGAIVTGLDASAELIQIAEEHKHIDPKIANNKPNYVHSTIEDHSQLLSDHYDAVVASEVIEHVNNQELFVKSCVKALKPGGRIFFTTPSKTRLSQFVIIFLCEDLLRLVPKGAHQYEKFISSNELTFILERNNCHVELTFGISYNPLTKNWDFTKYQQMMYALQAKKLS